MNRWVGAAVVSAVATGPSAATTGPELLAPGLINTPMAEQAPAVAADGRTLLFSAGVSFFGTYRSFFALVEATATAEGWSAPRVLGFSGTYSDELPALTPEGTVLFFVSNRPTGDEARDRFHARRLWRARRSAAGWGEPELVPGAFADFEAVHGCSAAAAGVLYCALQAKGGTAPDLYRLAPRAEGYVVADRLPDTVNSDAMDVHPAVDPSETRLVFASRRPKGLGGFDLWATRRTEDGWSPAAPLDRPVNSLVHDFTPAFDAKGGYLYFSSSRGFGDSPRDHALDLEQIVAGLRSVTNGQPNLYRVRLDEVLR